MDYRVVHGDLLDQPVDAIVNAWNRNLFPWWLLIPRGVAGAIRKRAGRAPFRELRRHGLIPLGGAVATGAGALECAAIIHVAAISLLWRSSARSIQDSVTNALRVAEAIGVATLAFPILGAGTGGMGAERAEALMAERLASLSSAISVTLVRFAPRDEAVGASAPRRSG